LVALAAALLTFFSFSVVQRRRYESLRQLEAERSALLDLATHQIGMPLATFRWWLEILRDKKDMSDGDLEAYEQLQVGVDRMDHIIRSLQDAAKLQAASATFNSERVDPAALVDEAVASMQSAFALKQQRIEVVREDVPDILADRKPMVGVLAELLENARGYSPAGSVVTVRVAKTGSGVRIEVEDRGCGIPAEHIPRMFQKFTRGVNAYAHKPVGNGLGLYICKGIVERARGKISVKSVEGKGTTVALEFPAAA
jgi:two-component system phosphate regulon sensor histidine kinase PhoR